jgi:WD40 repeat protein
MLPATTLPVSKCAAYLEFERKRPSPAGGNVVRGVRWAPDGSCLLTASEDNVLRVFNLPPTVARQAYQAACGAATGHPDSGDVGGGAGEMEPVLRIEEGESVYDCCWCADPASLLH